jgi:hypothetical protein
MAKTKSDLTEKERAKHKEVSERISQRVKGSETTRATPSSSKAPSDKPTQPRESTSKSQKNTSGSAEATRPKTAGKSVSSRRPMDMVTLTEQFENSTLETSDNDSNKDSHTEHRTTGGKSVLRARRPVSHANQASSSRDKSPDDSSSDSDRHHRGTSAHGKRPSRGGKSVPGWKPQPDNEDDDRRSESPPRHSSPSAGRKRPAPTPHKGDTKRSREQEPRTATAGPSTSAPRTSSTMEVVKVDEENVACSNCETTWPKKEIGSALNHCRKEICQKPREHRGPSQLSPELIVGLEAHMSKVADKDFIREIQHRDGTSTYKCRVCRSGAEHGTHEGIQKHVRSEHFCFEPAIKTVDNHPATCKCGRPFRTRRLMDVHYQSGSCEENSFELVDLVVKYDKKTKRQVYTCAGCGVTEGTEGHQRDYTIRHVLKNACGKLSSPARKKYRQAS